MNATKKCNNTKNFYTRQFKNITRIFTIVRTSYEFYLERLKLSCCCYCSGWLWIVSTLLGEERGNLTGIVPKVAWFVSLAVTLNRCSTSCVMLLQDGQSSAVLMRLRCMGIVVAESGPTGSQLWQRRSGTSCGSSVSSARMISKQSYRRLNAKLRLCCELFLNPVWIVGQRYIIWVDIDV